MISFSIFDLLNLSMRVSIAQKLLIKAKFTSHIKNVRVQERGKARLEYEMSSKDVHIRWLKDGCDITGSRRYVFTREGKRAEGRGYH